MSNRNGGQKFAMDDYVDVAERIAEFRTKHPDGSLQQVSLDFREVNGGAWVVYTAAAYRCPEDQRPGQGTAWEPVPGRTPYTRDSEVQNAETAAWGRAIVAALAADTKRGGIASAEEVRNAQGREAQSTPPPTLDQLVEAAQTAATVDVLNRVAHAASTHMSGGDLDAVKGVVVARRAELAGEGE